MNKTLRILVLVGSLGAGPALAADNAVIVTPGSGVTIRSIDIGGAVQAPGHAIVDATGGQLGISATPLFVRAPSGAIASGAIASGAVASGAVASGAIAAGALAIGSIVDGAYLTDGAIADAAVTAGATGSNSAKLRAISRDLGTIATNSGLPLPTQSVAVPIGGIGLCDGANGTTNPCTTVQTVLAASTASAAANKAAVVALSPNQGTPAMINAYPFGATPITASATGTTGATTATLAGTSGKTTYICGYSIRANATAAATVTNTITGVITATLSSIMWIAPLASGIGVDEQIFTPCIPASGTNQAIAVVSGAPGSGGTVSSKGWGYQL